MVQTSLFPELQQSIAAELDAEILCLLTGQAGGLNDAFILDIDERQILFALRFHRGLANTVQIRELQEKTKLDPRTIKNIIRGLRINFKLPIGSSKNGVKGGYYLMITAEDEAAWINDVFSQARAEFEVVRAVVRRQENLEMLGQMRFFDLEKHNG